MLENNDKFPNLFELHNFQKEMNIMKMKKSNRLNVYIDNFDESLKNRLKRKESIQDRNSNQVLLKKILVQKDCNRMFRFNSFEKIFPKKNVSKKTIDNVLLKTFDTKENSFLTTIKKNKIIKDKKQSQNEIQFFKNRHDKFKDINNNILNHIPYKSINKDQCIFETSKNQVRTFTDWFIINKYKYILPRWDNVKNKENDLIKTTYNKSENSTFSNLFKEKESAKKCNDPTHIVISIKKISGYLDLAYIKNLECGVYENVILVKIDTSFEIVKDSLLVLNDDKDFRLDIKDIKLKVYCKWKMIENT